MRPAGMALLFLAAAAASLAVAAGPACDLQQNLAIVPVEQNEPWAIEWWKERHLGKIQESRRADVHLLFIGDSITHGWEDAGAAVWQQFYQHRNAFNLGFSGDRTEHVLWRIDHGALDFVQPRLVVLLIGTNNTGHRMDPADHTAKGVRRIVESLRARLPDARVLILGVFPRHISPCNEMRVRNAEVNRQVAMLADGDAVHFLDIGEEFLNPDGTLRVDLMPDLLHLTETGYRTWADAMEPTLQRLLDEP